MALRVIAAAIAASALAACSSSAKSAAPPTVASTSTTSTAPRLQVEQKVPSRTRFRVDGRNVDLICRGHGRIPVVFQAGGRENGTVWNNLIASLGGDVFTCVFNRPGTTADEVDKPVGGELTTPNNVAATLADVLRQAGVGPRVIVVGHSIGGTDAIVFGSKYPGMTAGAVLFDPSVPEFLPESESTRIGFDAKATDAQAAAIKTWPDVPLVILTADSKLVIKNKEATPAEERGWIATHRRWASLSPQGEQREVPNTSHFVYLTAPQASRDAIREVLRKASG